MNRREFIRGAAAVLALFVAVNADAANGLIPVGLLASGAPAGKKDADILKSFQRKELKVTSLPKSVRVVEWTRKKGAPGRAWSVRFDLKDPKLRLTTRLGLTNDRSMTNRVATLDEMAATLVAEGRNPIVGINGNYFDARGSQINVYGPVVSDGKALICGGGNLLVETEDHVITLGKASIGGTPVTSDGKKIVNATGFYMEPTIRYDHGEYKTTDNPTYPRSLIGVGDKLLVFLVSDGRQPAWSVGIDDRQAIDMLVAEGCHTVAESDGGGSASMWIRNLPKKLAPRDKNYINRPSDGQPRPLGEGVFMTYEKATGQMKDKK